MSNYGLIRSKRFILDKRNRQITASTKVASSGNGLPVLLLVKNFTGSCKISGHKNDLQGCLVFSFLEDNIISGTPNRPSQSCNPCVNQAFT